MIFSKMIRYIYFTTLAWTLAAAGSAVGQEKTNVIAMCGASEGISYNFRDDIVNPDGPDWSNDEISDGQITLVQSGDQFDILFGDAMRATSYSSDGAQVVLLHWGNQFIRVGAFSNEYADIYNFDRIISQVAWSSNKSGPILGRVAVYVSDCRFVD